jgi:hypothetical protein
MRLFKSSLSGKAPLSLILPRTSVSTGRVPRVGCNWSAFGKRIHGRLGRSHEYKGDTWRNPNIRVAVVAHQQQACTTIAHRKYRQISLVIANRPHRDDQELADLLIRILQPELRPSFRRAQCISKACCSLVDFAKRGLALRRIAEILARYTNELDLLRRLAQLELRSANDFIRRISRFAGYRPRNAVARVSCWLGRCALRRLQRLTQIDNASICTDVYSFPNGGVISRQRRLRMR